MKRCHLAIDIGASSGRHIVGTVQDGQIKLKEIYRFENGLLKKNGHLCWDIENLKQNVINGMIACQKQGYTPATIGIDTWAVDFVLLDKNNCMIGDAVAYRDARTNGLREEFERNGALNFAEHYQRTGIQYQKFNTAYQLVALKKEHPEHLEQAETFLMIPDYLNFILTGRKVNEYTNATTTALVGAESKDWDNQLIAELGLSRRIFQRIAEPGTVLGNFTAEITKKVGFDCKVILPATHDTGSAFLAVPAKDENAVFLSSGTWSLMGVENKRAITTAASREANFTNEGGFAHRYRYLKNIMGLWMIQSVRKELETKYTAGLSFSELMQEAEKYASLQTKIDVDDTRFLAPSSMIEEIRKACREEGKEIPNEVGAVMQVIYHSLADDYNKTLKQLTTLTKRTYTSLNIVGGGSRDMYLNQATADETGLPVYAGPAEGTALGNLIVQFLEEGEFENLQEARNSIQTSFKIAKVMPKDM